MSKKEIIEEQIKLLSDWNRENATKEPEQARKNAETIAMLIDNSNRYLP